MALCSFHILASPPRPLSHRHLSHHQPLPGARHWWSSDWPVPPTLQHWLLVWRHFSQNSSMAFNPCGLEVSPHTAPARFRLGLPPLLIIVPPFSLPVPPARLPGVPLQIVLLPVSLCTCCSLYLGCSSPAVQMFSDFLRALLKCPPHLWPSWITQSIRISVPLPGFVFLYSAFIRRYVCLSSVFS